MKQSKESTFFCQFQFIQTNETFYTRIILSYFSYANKCLLEPGLSYTSTFMLQYYIA